MIEGRARGSIRELGSTGGRGQVVLYLELVFAGLGLRRRIEKINGENLGYLDLVILTTIQISWWRRCWSRAEPEEALLLDCADARLNAPF